MEETGSDELRSAKVNAQDAVDGKIGHFLPTEKCAKHPSELLNMYCGREETLCCTVCISLDHQSCNGQVVYIMAAAKNVAKSKEYSDVKGKLKSCLYACKKYNTERLGDKKRLCKERKEAQVKIEVFKSKIQKHVNILADNALKEVDRRFDSLTESIAKDVFSIESMIARIESEMIELQNKENECELFTSVKKGISLTKECAAIDKEMFANIGQEKITVTEDEHVFESLCLKNNIVHFIEVNPQPVSPCQEKMLCAELKKKVKLKDVIKDNYCDLSDVCCLKDGNMVVSDRYNYKLWLLNKSLEVKNELKIDGEPTHTCATADDEIAVAIYANSYDYYISFFQVKNMVLVECRKVFLTRACRGLCSKDNIVVASYGGWGFGMVETSGGRLLKFTRSGELREDIDNYDKVEKPGKLAIGTASNYLYIVDERNGLVCFDHRSGKNIFIKPKLNNITAVCVDKHNRLFVCDSSQSIVQLTALGKTVGTLLKSSDGIYNGKALCYDQNRDRLITLVRKSTIAVYKVHE